jgi:hypothetical protein
MVGADVDEAIVAGEVVGAVRDRLAGRVAGEVVDVDQIGYALGLPLAAPFLKLPTSSFFLVSTEITGIPCLIQVSAVVLMCSNCALRSGCWAPSTDLVGAWRL